MSENKRKQQSFEYGAIILVVSTVLVKIIGALFKIPLSSPDLLGDLGFGYFSSAYDLFTPIYTLAMAGLPIAVSRVVAEHVAAERYKDVRCSLRVTKKLFFITGFTAFLIMLLLIFPFVKLTDPTGETVYSLFAIAPALIFCCIMSTYRGYYEGLRNMYPTAISNIIEALGKLILGYGFAFITVKLTDNVAYGAAAAMLGIMVGTALSALYLRLRFKIKGDGITDEEYSKSILTVEPKAAAKAIILIAVPVVLSSLANSIASLVDVSMVKWQLTNLMGEHADTIRTAYAASIADYNNTAGKALSNDAIPTFLYGIRGKAFTIYNLAPTITSVLGVSAVPVLASSWTLGDKTLVKKNINSIIKLAAIIAMPAGLGFLALAGPIMNLLYSSTASVEIGGPMMMIYGITTLFTGLAIPMTSMLQAIGRQVSALRNIAIAAVLKVVVNFICVGIPSLNIKGAALGTFACYFFICMAHLFSLIKHTKVVPDFMRTVFKPFFAAVICGFVAYGISLLGSSRLITVAAIAAAGIVYFVALIVFKTFEKDDILAMPKGEKLLKLALKFKIVK